jgi:hypothetical protein
MHSRINQNSLTLQETHKTHLSFLNLQRNVIVDNIIK